MTDTIAQLQADLQAANDTIKNLQLQIQTQSQNNVTPSISSDQGYLFILQCKDDYHFVHFSTDPYAILTNQIKHTDILVHKPPQNLIHFAKYPVTDPPPSKPLFQALRHRFTYIRYTNVSNLHAGVTMNTAKTTAESLDSVSANHSYRDYLTNFKFNPRPIPTTSEEVDLIISKLDQPIEIRSIISAPKPPKKK
jgi:hypothetical protein